jgi:3',5'-cyclic AMP phosphodiesterase CpdA
MQQKVAILSDLHCHPKNVQRWDSLLHYDAPKVPTNKHPIASVLRLIGQEKLRADALLIPGDLTNRMNPEGLRAGWAFCKEVANALETDLVAATLGNHDVDYLGKIGPNPFEPARALHAMYPVSAVDKQKDFWNSGFCILERPPLRVVVINSVSQYTDSDEVKRGYVTDEQLELLRDRLSVLKPQPFQVALMHHHPIQHEILGLGSDDLMKNGENLISILLDLGFHLAVHGHKHHPRIAYSGGGTNSLLILAAGSIAATTEKGLLSNTRNLFHIVELDDNAVVACGPHGVIRSWEFHLYRGWKPATIGAADVPAVTGFGCHCDFSQLAEQIFKWFDREVGSGFAGFFEWQELLRVFPQLQYLIPTDLKDLAKLLTNRYRIELIPTPPDTPERIGRLK